MSLAELLQRAVLWLPEPTEPVRVGQAGKVYVWRAADRVTLCEDPDFPRRSSRPRLAARLGAGQPPRSACVRPAWGLFLRLPTHRID